MLGEKRIPPNSVPAQCLARAGLEQSLISGNHLPEQQGPDSGRQCLVINSKSLVTAIVPSSFLHNAEVGREGKEGNEERETEIEHLVNSLIFTSN